jgi:hypothetical protein
VKTLIIMMVLIINVHLRYYYYERHDQPHL